MPTYFKPLRRKLGVVTLMVACLLTGVWFRGRTVQDSYWFGFGVDGSFVSGKYVATSGNVMHVMSSSLKDGLVWERTEDDGISWFGGWHTSDSFSFSLFHPQGWDLAPDSKIYHSQIFGFEIVKYQNDNYGTYSFWRTSHAYLIVPLTVLSVWLLFSKPREKKPPQPQSGSLT